MKELELSEDERRAVRNEITSDAWKPIGRILDHLRDQASSNYNNTHDNHVYYQAKLHAIFEVIMALEKYSKPIEIQEDQPEEVPDMAILHAVSSATDY